jgi:hypothetical protein
VAVVVLLKIDLKNPKMQLPFLVLAFAAMALAQSSVRNEFPNEQELIQRVNSMNTTWRVIEKIGFYS